MITKDLIVSAIKGGLTPAEIVELVQDAVNDIELEKQNDPKRLALMDGMMAYMGRDHDLWNEMDPWDALEVLEDVLAEMVVCNCPLANCTEQECNCAADCSCDEKIKAKTPKVIGKVATYDENGKRVERNLTMDDVDGILGDWLKYIVK